jgi:hypothetical protein
MRVQHMTTLKITIMPYAKYFSKNEIKIQETCCFRIERLYFKICESILTLILS